MITASAFDRICSLITDLQSEMMRAGVKPTVRILVRKDDLAAIAAASAGSRWASRSGPEGGLRIADAVIGVGG